MAEGKHAVEFGVLLGSGTIRCVRKAQYISAVVTVIIVIATTITIIISCCAFGSPRRLVVCLFVCSPDGEMGFFLRIYKRLVRASELVC